MPDTIRKRYIVRGKVQHVGYRALVRAFADTLGLRGVVRNLPDKTVEVVCEGEPEAIASLLQMINRKGDPMKAMSIIVKSIEDCPPPPSGEFTDFIIDYGRKLNPIERESLDRDEMMILGAVTLEGDIGGVRTDMQGVGSDVREVGKKVDCLGQKMDGVGKDVREVGQKVDGVGKAVEGAGQKVDGVGKAVHEMRSDMNTRFDQMADRYDMIGASLKEAIVHMDRNAEKTDRAIEKSRKESALESNRTRKEIAKGRRETIIEVRKNQKETAKILSESRKEVADSNRELAKAVNFMIRKLSDRPARKRPAGKRKR
jgi:acylphosphatase